VDSWKPWNDAIAISIALSHMLRVALLAWDESDEEENLCIYVKTLETIANYQDQVGALNEGHQPKSNLRYQCVRHVQLRPARIDAVKQGRKGILHLTKAPEGRNVRTPWPEGNQLWETGLHCYRL
jgi:Asp-tRNA(Asn)/Glu-tRNA(Gln) amidotransferase C subunit